MTTDLAQREIDVTDGSYMEKWTDRQKALMLRTVAEGATGEELHLFLSQAAQLNLNPLTREIWCIKTRGRNGGEGRIAIIIGEQGRLKIASRYEDSRGYRSGVVCENDRFVVMPEPKPLPGVEGCFTYVEHSFGSPDGRGGTLGGWCEVYRLGRPPVFFYAPLTEYAPDPEKISERARDFSPWFKQESRMIEKCAISTAHRIAYNLAGVYGEEEMTHIRRQEGEKVVVEDEIEWGDAEDVADRMRSLVAAANNAKANSYPPAKVRLLLAGLSDEDRIALAAQELIPFIHAHGGTVPEAGDLVVDESEMAYEDGGQEGEPVTLPGVEDPEDEPEPEPGERLPGV